MVVDCRFAFGASVLQTSGRGSLVGVFEHEGHVQEEEKKKTTMMMMMMLTLTAALMREFPRTDN